jgi:hypothetical protein
MRRSFYTRASTHPLLTGALLLSAGVATGAFLARRHRSGH